MPTKPQSIFSSKFSLLAAFLFIWSAVTLQADNPADFEEDPDAVPDTGIDWPDVEFEAAEKRGTGFIPGETYNFRAQWGIFSRAGNLTIETETTEDDKLLVTTTTNSKGFIRRLYPLTLEGKTILDPENWRMVSNYVNGLIRKDETTSNSLFDYESGTMTHHDENQPKRNGKKQIPYPVVLDYSCALLQMRGWDLKIGNQYPLLVSSKGKFYFVELKVIEKEIIKSLIGDIEAFVIQPINAVPESKLFREGGDMKIWVSADDRRLPLQLEVKTKIGKATIRLESVQLNPNDSIAARQENVASSSL